MTLSLKIEFLKKIGSDTERHINQTLLEHLIGVYDLLKKWGAPKYIQDAGLFHSVYGTTYFKPKIIKDRDVVRELIGEEAEELVYLFCSIKHPRAYNIKSIKDKKIKDALLLINNANNAAHNIKIEDIANTKMDRLDFYKDV